MPRFLILLNRIKESLQSGWTSFFTAYQAFNYRSHRLLRWSVAAVLIAYFLFCGVFLTLRYLILPNVGLYKSEIEQVASQFVGKQIGVDEINASWSGLHPRLQLKGVVIHGDSDQAVLTLPEVDATLSWITLVAGQLRLEELEILQPDLEIMRDEKGKIFIAGIALNMDKSGDTKGLDWLLSQKQISIINGSLRWQDKLRGAPELELKDLTFILRNQWFGNHFSIKATPPAELAAPIDVRAHFTHPPFSTSISDYQKWKGEIYLDWRNTRLDDWKKYIDYPFQVEGGQGSVRAWLNFDHAVVSNFTADVALKDLTLQLEKNLAPLKLVEVSGQIFAGEAAVGLKERIFSFGRHGHAVKLTNFSLQTDQGAVLPATTVNSIFIAGSASKLEKHEISVVTLDLDTLAQLARHLPLGETEKKLLEEFRPHGNLQDFLIRWEGEQLGVANYEIKGKFSGLALKGQKKSVTNRLKDEIAFIPEFEGLSGEVIANQSGGTLNLQGDHAKISLQGLFAQSDFNFEQLDLRSGWSFKKRDHVSINIGSLEFLQDGIQASVSGQYSLPLKTDNPSSGILDIKVHIPEIALKKIYKYLPLTIPRDTRDWMAGALLDGNAENIDLIVQGDLDQFPFEVKQSDSKPSGVFKITGNITGGKLDPGFGLQRAGQSAAWPKLEEIRGQIVLDKTNLKIHTDTARTAELNLSDVNVEVPNYWVINSMLEVNGLVAGSLQSMVSYANASPVSDFIYQVTDEMRGTGNAKVNLRMSLPLGLIGTETIQGKLLLSGNDIQLFRGTPSLQQMRGEIGFTEKGFFLAGVHGSYLGGQVNFNGGIQRDGSSQVNIDGAITAEGLSKAFLSTSMRKLSKRFTGSTRYNATLRLKNQHAEFSFDSNLIGLSIDLPAPLGKSAPEALPLKFSLIPISSDNLNQTQEARLNLGRALSARYVLQKPNTKTATWKMVRGGIGVNSTIPQSEQGLALNASLPSVNTDSWNKVISAIAPDPAIARIATDAGLDFSPYVTPDSVSLQTSELIVSGKPLTSVALSATHARDGWNVNLRSDQAVGQLLWSDPSSERGAGKITARLVALVIPKSNTTEVTEILSGKASGMQLPGIDLVADNLELMGIKLGRLELSATNSGPIMAREWRINKLIVTNPDAILKASGKWTSATGDGQSAMTVDLEIIDAGRLLDRFGFEKMLKAGKGNIDGELFWKGAPYSFDPPTLSGNLSMKLANGQFLKVEPGVAKLLGVMSLQALPRRLTLDFRDVFSEGFAFDGIASTANISRGVIKTDTFKMRGTSSVILMDGTVDLKDETQNLNVVVIPEMNAGAASVAYGLAVNPIIGLGSFLAQFLLKNPLSQAFTQEYQITGPWKDPAIKKIATKRKTTNDPADAVR
ncbi:MAG: hypothetical protein RI984_1560 [Pseudomonadota bacterium]